MQRALPRVPAGAWITVLLLGVCLEANAFYRHMAFHGRQVYGRSALLAEAVEDSRLAQARGTSISTALMETRSTDLRFLVSPSKGPSAETWVFLPPEFHAAAAALGDARVYRRSNNDVPVLVLRAQGAQARRFNAAEEDLRGLLDSRDPGAEQAWLQSSRPKDDWCYAAVLDRHVRRLWQGLPLDRALMQAFVARPQVTAGPLDRLGRYLIGRDPKAALQALDRALLVDPNWGPALLDRVAALRALGRDQEAQEAEALRQQRSRDGSWQVYD